MSATQKKILILLFRGLEFGYSYTPQRQWRVLKNLARDWKRIDREELRKEINNLYRSKAIKREENKDGSITIILTEKGKTKALNYHFENMIIKGEDWDGKWRIVIFDIPEKMKNGRNALREKIKKLGFYELQKSVWIFPYKCENEINFIIEFFNLRKYVRFAVLESIDNEFHLKKIFNLE
jgi:DNA-binding transcriptional regulator PaaX